MAPLGRPPNVVAMEFRSWIALPGGAASVSVEDSRFHDLFQIAVPPDRALHPFYHPNAYAT